MANRPSDNDDDDGKSQPIPRFCYVFPLFVVGFNISALFLSCLSVCIEKRVPSRCVFRVIPTVFHTILTATPLFLRGYLPLCVQNRMLFDLIICDFVHFVKHISCHCF